MSLCRDMMPPWEMKEEMDRQEAEITALRAENERLKAELHTASDMNAVYEGRLQKEEAEIERLRALLEGWDEANRLQHDYTNTLRAEVERLRVENIQMQAALGYGILAEDERHIIPVNPFKCGTCDARHVEVKRLRRLLWEVNEQCPEHVPVYLLKQIRESL